MMIMMMMMSNLLHDGILMMPMVWVMKMQTCRYVRVVQGGGVEGGVLGSSFSARPAAAECQETNFCSGAEPAASAGCAADALRTEMKIQKRGELPRGPPPELNQVRLEVRRFVISLIRGWI